MTIYDSIIAGAGVGGLTVGLAEIEKKRSVLILEKSSRAGGVLRSEKKEGFLLEFGPNTVLLNEDLWNLIKKNGLEEKALLADAKIPRYILHNGLRHPVPMGAGAFLTSRLLSPLGKLRLLCEPVVSQRKQEFDESLFMFAKRRMGVQAAERLVAPFVSGVWAGDAKRLSAEGAFPAWVGWEKNHGSLFKGLLANLKEKRKKPRTYPKGLLSFEGGLQVLAEKLASPLSDSVKTKIFIEGVLYNKANRAWTVRTTAETYESKRLYVNLPAKEAAHVFGVFDPNLASALYAIPYAPIIVIHLAIAKKDTLNDVVGFGHLSAPSDNSPLLGCLYSSAIFPSHAPEGFHLFTAFMGGASHPEDLKYSDEELHQRAAQALENIFGFKRTPRLLSLFRYEEAIPQYNVGHSKALNAILAAEDRYPGLSFVTNYRSGISVGDMVALATRLANN